MAGVAAGVRVVSGWCQVAGVAGVSRVVFSICSQRCLTCL